jgi:RsiW-degrading membrane proteinase PrsW (M82 family)
MPVGILLFLNILETFLARDDTLVIWDLSIAWTMIVIVLCLLYRAKFERTRVRRAVMKMLFEKRAGGSGGTDDIFVASADTHLQLHAHDIRRAHATCSCYPIDVAYVMATTQENDDDAQLETTTSPRDLCTHIWKSLRCLCCGWLCGCWCQFCGMCAIAQEDRELQLMLDQKQLQVDYITFQPYDDYYPAIQALRTAKDGSLIRHWRALSLLSYNLVKILVTCLVVLTIVAVLQLDPKFQIQNLIVVLATFTQAFAILYFCHWQWNRFDLSIDALVKYFASGFVLCTFLAIVYEILVSWVLGIISYTIVVVGISNDVTSATSPEQVKQAAADFAKEHVGIFAIFVFLNAFVVAALVEEMCKYFGYWMVETPDLLDSDELAIEATDESSSQQQTLAITKRSRVSQGAGITVSMVAVAAGFACSENLLYVFVYTPPIVSNEIATLVARSMFPIHPLCAAIQSIGVVRRDVEKNLFWQLGWIMLPAIVLHGAFDFVLMFLELLESSNKSDPSNGGSATPSTDDATFFDMGQGDSLPLILSVSLVVVGLLYFGCESQSQKNRLEALDVAGLTDTENLV